MKTKIFLYIGITSIILVLSFCSTLKSKRISFRYTLSRDTLFAKMINDGASNNDTCRLIANNFHKRFGIVISDYYVIKDSLSIDLNDDQIVDALIVLSPLSLELEHNECKIDSCSKRLLVEVIKDIGRAKIRNVYNDLISNFGGVLSHYNGMHKTNNGFEIIHQAGARYSWLYKMEFSVANKNELRLTKIFKRCSFDGLDKTREFRYNQLSLDKVNVPDTLKRQCNCDQLWMELEKQ